MALESVRLQRRNDVVDGSGNLVLLVWSVSVCGYRGGTDSIHLAPERVDDDANGLVGGSCVVGVADVELDRHGDLALVAREVPAIEGHTGGLHGCLFAVGFANRFAVGKLRHGSMFCGRVWGFCTRTRVCWGERFPKKDRTGVLRLSGSCRRIRGILAR